ncbi:phosphatidylserine lipase ABHD16A [Daktulosphaira vitifoliae]|uniref:phosphatidylserine lipase ABHD16A n=1 Tax=Daktulosphaira vitifoliae TaxID=58002 RepID=UPI0021A9C1C6|nr:phosphatidylserine lipase ABHD16A [Daktulosphaira vitifoliae]
MYKLFIQFMFSPKLYKINTGLRKDEDYIQLWQEKFADRVLFTSYVITRVVTYLSPIIFYYYGKSLFSLDLINKIIFRGSVLSVTLITSLLLRSYGRSMNPKYQTFYRDLSCAQLEYSNANQKKLHNYDFDFSAWPVDFSWSKADEDNYNSNLKRRSMVLLVNLLKSPSSLIGFIALHTFGIMLIYPGSTSLLFYLMKDALQKGRRTLISRFNGIRYKLKTIDGNFLDSIFIDNRNKNTISGRSKLIICSEGNAGFYEAGILSSAIDTQHSVLGWNHPGFGYSTGVPYIEQEQNAAETVIEFAIKKLNFRPEDIILYGWSIGGFASTYLAKKFPDVHAVILDATFDDLVPLAVPRMPSFAENLVVSTVREFTNLHVAANLLKYPGPVLLIRRSGDEIIALDPQNIATNRANNLLESFLEYRYPKLFTDETRTALWEWMSKADDQQKQVLIQHNVDINEQAKKYPTPDNNYPSNLGSELDDNQKTKMLIYLADHHMKDYNSTHCTPLPSRYLNFII